MGSLRSRSLTWLSRLSTPPARYRSSIKNVPLGCRLASTGTPAPAASKSSSVRSTPSRPAIASRCTTEFVEPPTAAIDTIALMKASLVMMSLGRRFSATIDTISEPVSWDSDSSRASGAGVPANPGIVMPSASAMTAIVEAVPIVLQWPFERIIDCSDARNSLFEITPARASSLRRQTSVPHPSASPLK